MRSDYSNLKRCRHPMPFAAMPGSDSEVGPIATPDAPALMKVLDPQSVTGE